MVGTADSVLIREVSFIQITLYREFCCITFVRFVSTVCNNKKLDVYICHNLKENMLAIAVVQKRYNSKADYMKCLINNLRVFFCTIKISVCCFVLHHFNAQKYILEK